MDPIPPENRSRFARPLFLASPLMAIVPLVAVLPLLAGSLSATVGSKSDKPEPMTFRVMRGDFIHEVTVEGELESSVNVEVRCEVRSRGSSWIRILEVVPEGTIVEPGDFLVRLDSSALENDRMQTQSLLEQAEAWLIEARSNYVIAQSARQEYLEGEYAIRRRKAEMALFLAEEKARRAARYAEYSRAMAARGYITPVKLEADEFAVKAAELERDLARTRLRVLEEFTKVRRLQELDGKVASCKAQVESAERTCRLRREQLAEIEAQIEKCVIRAPVAGQVVLAHLHHYGHSHMVEPGELARQNRTLIRLPDPRKMQVKALINEDKIALIRPDAPVRIYLEAYPEHELHGKVVKVSEYPNPESWFGPAVKQYEAIISLEPCPLPLRPGLTGDVKICVNRLEDQLLVPCHAVLEHGDKSYCISANDDGLTAREVVPGPSNRRFTVIKSGLEEGQEIVLGADGFRDLVVLPELPESPKTADAAAGTFGQVCIDTATAR